MMISIKILAIAITALLGLLQIGLEYKWKDRRTKKHKKIRSLLIALMIIGSLTAVFLVIYDDRESEKQIQSLTFLQISAEKSAKDAKYQISSLSNLKLSADKAALEAEKREHKAQEDRIRIQSELDKINDQMKPLIDIATANYPNLSTDNALKQLTDRIKTIDASLVNTKKELESTKQELLRKTSDRSLTREQKHSLKSSLGGVTGLVIIKADFSNSEAQMFADQIKDAMEQTELEVTEKVNTELMSLYAKGIRMLVNDIQNPPSHALPILKAFEGIGINVRVSWTEKAKIPQGALIIWICHK